MAESPALLARLIAAAAALAITGCESGAETSKGSRGTQGVVTAISAEKRQVVRVIERFEDAVNKGDARRICRTLLARQSSGKRCIRDLGMLFRHPIYRNFEISVRRVTIRGRRATANVVLRIRTRNGTRGERDKYSLVKEDGEWRLRLQIRG